MKYELVQCTDHNTFLQSLKDLLETGWELYGSPYFADGEHCQAMIKRKYCYKNVTASSVHDLDAKVDAEIQKGKRPLGGIALINGSFIQSLV